MLYSAISDTKTPNRETRPNHRRIGVRSMFYNVKYLVADKSSFFFYFFGGPKRSSGLGGGLEPVLGSR